LIKKRGTKRNDKRALNEGSHQNIKNTKKLLVQAGMNGENLQKQNR
jgi:hypothetical protein